MRIEQDKDEWLVFAEPGEFFGNTKDVLLGSLTRGGKTRILVDFRSNRFRRQEAQLALNSALRDLRAMREENETGSFIVELDNGEMRRFHSLRRDASARRPAATDWAEEALRSGRASHADLFRHTMTGDPRRAEIFYPHILPARAGHPRMVVGEYEQLPLHSWSLRRPPYVRSEGSPEVQRAYALKKHAMDLVIDFWLRGVHPRRPGDEPLPRPSEMADAWAVAEDAFQEARLPLQVDFAHANLEHWASKVRSDAAVRRWRR